MLATPTRHAPPPSQAQPLHSSTPCYLPSVPSPLSPRSANIHGRRANFASMSKPTQSPNSNSSSPAQPQAQPFAKRPIKKAPSPRQDDLKEKRRSNFLRKVQEGREDKRFESRGEDIMRRDYLRRRKQWEEQLAAEAPMMDLEPAEEEEAELPSSGRMQFSTQGSLPALEEADEVARREREELEALLDYMPGQEELAGGGEGMEQQLDGNLWSDDDDYDALFSELMEREGASGGASQQEHGRGGDAMDMS